MKKHTPGPWKVRGQKLVYTDRPDAKEEIAICLDVHPNWPHVFREARQKDMTHHELRDEAEANALLISKAPTMLETLEKTRNSLAALVGTNPSLQGDIDIINEVIIEATGADRDPDIGWPRDFALDAQCGSFHLGQRVFWNDPDEDECSSLGVVVKRKPDQVYVLQLDEMGAIVEALAEELSLTDTDINEEK